MSFANDFSPVSYRKLKTEFATGLGGRYFFPDTTLFLAFFPSVLLLDFLWVDLFIYLSTGVCVCAHACVKYMLQILFSTS